MKSIVSLLSLAAVLAIVQPGYSQKPFEGIISMRMVVPPDTAPHDATITLKGDKMELDLDLGMQGLIKLYPQPENHKIFVALMAMKSGQEIAMPNEAAAPATKIDLKPLRKKGMIAGHPVKAYRLSTPQVNFTLWEASDLPTGIRLAYLTALPHLMQEDPSIKGALAQLASKKMVPLRIELSVKVMPDQKIAFEFVKAEQRQIDDAVFELPKDVKFSVAPIGGAPDGNAPREDPPGNAPDGGGMH